MTDTPEVPRPQTPASIWFALFCFGFAIAAPFIGGLKAEMSHGDGWQSIGIVLIWALIGGAAAVVGIICTIVGAWRSPRTIATMFTIALACVFGLGLLVFLGSLAR